MRTSSVLDTVEHDVYSLDKREMQSLQQQLNDEAAVLTKQDETHDVLVAAELRKQKILQAESSRILTRVLFVVSDPTCFEEEVLMKKYGQFSSVFEEIHILLVSPHRKHPLPTKRLAKNVWQYMASSRYLFWRPQAAKKVVQRELVFTDGFRPDTIVATDPFMAGIVAEQLAKKYGRPWQLHVSSVAFLDDPQFAKNTKDAHWQLKTAPNVIQKASSIRCGSEHIYSSLTENFKTPGDIRLLPKFFDIARLADTATQKEQSQTFPQFHVTLMYVGWLDSDSLLHQVLDAARFLLSTATTGLVVVGNGSFKDKFMERAKLLGIEEQVLFLGRREPYTEVLTGASLLIVPEQTAAADELVIKAAALGVPLLLTENEFRTTLFEDETSALLVPANDVIAMSRKIKRFVDLKVLRTSLSSNALQAVTTQIVEDPLLYKIAYRNTIEEVLYVEGKAQAHKDISASVKEATAEARRRQTQYTDVDGLTMKLPQQEE